MTDETVKLDLADTDLDFRFEFEASVDVMGVSINHVCIGFFLDMQFCSSS